MWQSGVGGGEAFYTQSLSESVPLDYEFHKCFSGYFFFFLFLFFSFFFLPPPVGQDGSCGLKLIISLPQVT